MYIKYNAHYCLNVFNVTYGYKTKQNMNENKQKLCINYRFSHN